MLVVGFYYHCVEKSEGEEGELDGTMCGITFNRHFLCMSPLESMFWRSHGVEDRVALIFFGMTIEVYQRGSHE